MLDNHRDPERENLFYGALLHAWLESRMEKDRTLIALSAGGVGLIATFLTGFAHESLFALVTFGTAALCFIAAINAGLRIFTRNAEHVRLQKEALERGDDSLRADPELECLDRTMQDTFRGGVILTIIAALIAAWPATSQGDPSMAKGTSVETTQRGQGTVKKSLNGVGSMRPAPTNSPAQGSGSGSQTPSATPPKKD